MKFRDPMTGKVFEDIVAAMDFFCFESHRECDKCDFRNKQCGNEWIRDHPADAARLMGYEVIDEKEEIKMPGGRCGPFSGLPRGPENDKTIATLNAEYAIRREREAQDEKWGFPQHNTCCEWSSILAEETGELAKELNELNFGRGNRERMRAEAVQVAAVAISILIHDDLGAIVENRSITTEQARSEDE